MSQDDENQTNGQSFHSPSEEEEGAGPTTIQEVVQDDMDETSEYIDLTHSWSALSKQEKRDMFNDLPRLEAEELFLSLRTHDQAQLIEEVSPMVKRGWVRLLAPDDVADLIQELGPEHREEILALVDPQTRREVFVLLAYKEDQAGGLMSSRFVRLRPEMNVDQAISYLRIQARTQVETIYYCYVLDSDQTLLGVVSFRELFSATSEKLISDIMTTDVVKVPTDWDQEQVVKLFSQQSLMAVPVIDEKNHMKGIITFDDIADAIQEEATEDIQKMAAIERLDAPYFQTTYLEMIKKRAGWLTVLFVGETFTATTMHLYESQIQRAAVLATFIPLIISSGGNTGSQASTLIIRAMSLGEVRLKDWWRIVGRELTIGISLGLILGVIGFFRVYLWPDRAITYGPHFEMMAWVVALSLLGVVTWGTLMGSVLPIILRRCGVDPATASAPFIATLCDVTGIMIYFSLATYFLSGYLL